VIYTFRVKTPFKRPPRSRVVLGGLMIGFLIQAARASCLAGAQPQVVIESRAVDGEVVRVKGFILGTALKSGGIYAGGRCLKAFAVNGVAGEQKIDLDLAITNPAVDTVIRVIDADGRSAEAPFFGVTPANPAAPVAPDDTTAEQGAIAEIPSHGPPMPSPSKRRTLAGQLGDAQIQIVSVERTATTPPAYEVIGQIEGRGITHAGIYVGDRLVQKLPADVGADFVSFDEHIVLDVPNATIRAYALGDHYVETPLDLSGASW
jgi:hypothetical protein